jgi:hypothetical protein
VPRIIVVRNEKWPDYEIRDTSLTTFNREIEITEAELAFVKKAALDYKIAQEILSKAYPDD